MYKNLNLNPKNKKTSDCVIRSFSLVSGKSWDQTLKDLCEIALQLKVVPNDKEAYTKYADNLGFKKCKVEVLNSHRPTVNNFAITHPEGLYILRCANHLVTVKHGDYCDIWDCGSKSIYMYWDCN